MGPPKKGTARRRPLAVPRPETRLTWDRGRVERRSAAEPFARPMCGVILGGTTPGGYPICLSAAPVRPGAVRRPGTRRGPAARRATACPRPPPPAGRARHSGSPKTSATTRSSSPPGPWLHRLLAHLLRLPRPAGRVTACGLPGAPDRDGGEDPRQRGVYQLVRDLEHPQL